MKVRLVGEELPVEVVLSGKRAEFELLILILSMNESIPSLPILVDRQQKVKDLMNSFRDSLKKVVK